MTSSRRFGKCPKLILTRSPGGASYRRDRGLPVPVLRELALAGGHERAATVVWTYGSPPQNDEVMNFWCIFRQIIRNWKQTFAILRWLFWKFPATFDYSIYSADFCESPTNIGKLQNYIWKFFGKLSELLFLTETYWDENKKRTNWINLKCITMKMHLNRSVGLETCRNTSLSC